jgi:hypothetical protein
MVCWSMAAANPILLFVAGVGNVGMDSAPKELALILPLGALAGLRGEKLQNLGSVASKSFGVERLRCILLLSGRF